MNSSININKLLMTTTLKRPFFSYLGMSQPTYSNNSCSVTLIKQKSQILKDFINVTYPTNKHLFTTNNTGLMNACGNLLKSLQTIPSLKFFIVPTLLNWYILLVRTFDRKKLKMKKHKRYKRLQAIKSSGKQNLKKL